MNKNEKSYMHVALVLDASGSMAGIRNATVESLKKFFQGFASEEDKTILDVWQFNDRVRHIVDGADLAKGAPETLEGYETDGCTALYDAVCVGIDELGRKLAAMPEAERPDGVAFAILTDGFENASTDFTAQDALCRAFRYVTRDDMPVLYLLSGHGEGGWDGELNRVCFRNGIAVETLVLAPGESVPEDAAAVILCGPTSPVGEETAATLLSYLQGGGDLLLQTNYTTDFTGLDSLVEYYGMARRKGLVLDNDAGHIFSADYKYFLKPDMRSNAVTDGLIEGRLPVLVPVAEAIARSDVRRAGLNAQPILLTSDQGYMKTNTDAVSTLDLEPQDETGSFIVGMAAVEGDTHLTWLGSISMFAEANNSGSSGGNDALLESILQQMFDFPAAEAALPASSLLTNPASIPMIPALIVLAALPLACLVIGLLRRKKQGGPIP